ncbi:tetratricopeptide repeat protein [Treponema pedis]|uniref:tetratricopeptide repeat protein n=1 Tax=Treponema pedis TaxID=409322 RepID=UPI0004260D72|nr:tetratricopeptide repeat protein [Treponema pedis]
MKIKCICYCLISGVFLFVSCVTTNKAVNSEQVKAKPQKESPRAEFAGKLNENLKKGDYEAALVLFDNLKEPLASDSKIKILKLSVLISANKIKEASTYASALEAEYPENTDILYAQAMLAQAENNAAKKNTYLDKILAKNPKDTHALTEKGSDLYGKKQYNEARKRFLEAYKADKTNIEALIGLARINYMQNKLEQAELNLNEVLKQQPDNSIALAELARIKSETDRMYEALKDINKAASIDPKIPGHWMDLGAYNMQIGRKKEALAAYNNAINLDPDSYLAYIYRAGLNDELGNKEEALKDYVKVCNLYPAYYFALEGAGILFWEKSDWLNARTAFVKALAKAPASYQYAILAVICSYKMNKKQEAKTFMQNYLKTIDRSKNETEYFICRLFADFAGDSELINRAYNEKDMVKKGRLFFYIAEFYNLTKKDNLAQKFYNEVLSIENPGFFEYRLAKAGIKQ